MTPTPTPAQIAKAEEIAWSIHYHINDENRDTVQAAIAAALADEAQQRDDYVWRNATELEKALRAAEAKLADAEQRGRQAGLREAAELTANIFTDSPDERASFRWAAKLIRQLAEEGPEFGR